MTEHYGRQEYNKAFWDHLVSETEIPIPGTLEGLGDLGVFIDFEHRNGAPSDHVSPRTPLDTIQKSATSAGQPCRLNSPSGVTPSQPTRPGVLLKLITVLIESINYPKSSPAHGEASNEVQMPDQNRDYSEVPQNGPGLVHQGGEIGHDAQIVHHSPKTIYKLSRANAQDVQEPRPRKRESVARKRTKLGLDQNARVTVCRDDTGNIQSIRTIFGAEQRPRAPFDDESKKLTAATRREGACVKCRRGKKRCDRAHIGDPRYESCTTCMRSRLGLLRMPCFKVEITEAALFRLQPSTDNPLHNWGFRKQVCKLEDDIGVLVLLRKLWITQDVGIESTVHISVAQFTPKPEDKTGYVWMGENGANTMEMPHYWITNIQEVRREMNEYIQLSVDEYIELALKGSDGILRDTFVTAARVASSGNHMVRRALSLWSASRMIEKTWRICGEDKLGLEASTDPANPWNGIIPVTPIMDTQLDQIVIKDFLVPLRASLLQELQEKISGYKRENWFSIFLTIFILLSNTEYILAHSRRFAKRYGMGGRYGYPGQYSSSEGFFHGAKILLAHFHFISKGYLPLLLDWRSPKTAAVAGLDAEQAEYMNRLKEQIQEKGRSMLDLRSKHKYETDLYWCHQMFFEGWTPGQRHIEEEAEVHEQAP